MISFCYYTYEGQIRSTGPQQLSLKLSNPQKWLPYQIIFGKTVKNVQIDPQTTEIWVTNLNVTLSVSLGLS